MVAKTTSSLVWLAVLSGFFLFVSGPTVGARAATSPRELEKALLEQVAPAVLKYVNENRYQNVGVLKGRVKKGDGHWTDNAGTFNTNLANRLELALIAKDDIENQVLILNQASLTAAKIAGANHLKPQTRQRLFTGDYPMAWGKETPKADAFVVADAEFSRDLRRVKLFITIFGKDGKVWGLVPIPVNATANILGEIGETFMLRGAFDEKDASKVETTAFKTVLEPQLNPIKDLKSDDAPVDLAIFYQRGNRPGSGDAVPYQLVNGQAAIPDPQEGQYVTLVLKRKDLKRCYGVVLLVNGESTIYHEQGDALKLHKWILNDQYPEIAVRGYQEDIKTVKRFEGLSAEESAPDRINYTPHTGTIQMIVFRQANDDDVMPSEGNGPLASLSKAQPLPPEDSLRELKAKIKMGGQGLGGLFVGKRLEASEVEEISFQAFPVPLLSATIRYYKP